MPRNTCWAAALLVVGLASATALANPVVANVLRLRQVPKTRHVQVTYATSGKDAPTEVSRDGTVLAVTWTALAGFSANNGSGVTTLAGQQFCDCNLPLGKHSFKVKNNADPSYGYVTLEGAIDVVDNYSLPPPPDAGGPDLAPWNHPEPTGIQGLDCTKACSSGPGAEAGTSGADKGTARVDGGAQQASKDSGCSLGGPAPTSGLLLVLSLLVVGLLRPRRR